MPFYGYYCIVNCPPMVKLSIAIDYIMCQLEFLSYKYIWINANIDSKSVDVEISADFTWHVVKVPPCDDNYSNSLRLSFTGGRVPSWKRSVATGGKWPIVMSVGGCRVLIRGSCV